MDRCPPEVLLKIVQEACTDGGYTGCSLSLVSRYTRDAIQPARYQSVALIDGPSVLAFSKLLDQSLQPVVVRYLFLSFTNHPEDPLLLEEDEPTWSAIEKGITRILRAAAPAVRELTVHGPFALARVLQNAQSFTVPFPCLTHLSIPYLSPNFGAAKAQNGLPSLRRLHISSGEHGYARCPPYPGLQFEELLVPSVPHITHLRISGIINNYRLLQFLRVLLDVPFTDGPRRADDWEYNPQWYRYEPGSEEAAQATKDAARLAGLRYVVVQPGVRRDEDMLGVFQDFHFISGLRDIEADSARGVGVGKLRLLPPSKEYSLEEARRDWTDVVNGGDGPWDAS